MPYGFLGKVLHVDLTRAAWTVEEPPEALYRTYLGGSGLGLYYLLREMPPGTPALAPENVLVFSLGVVTGAAFSGQSRCTANARSPLTGAIGDSQVGGFFPAELKAAGFDALVIRGAAATPVYLWIKDGAVELRPADHLWGADTATTEDAIRAELAEPKARCAAIGRAGENRNALANIMHMASRAFGRTGLGAVMGAKRLKAIAVRGTQPPAVFDRKALQELHAWGAKNLRANPSVEDLHVNGTAGCVPYQQLTGGLPTRNWRSGVFERFEEIAGETMTATLLKSRDTCYACVTRCKRVVEIAEGPYRVAPRFGGPEYETIAALGAYCGIGDLAAIAKGNELCNRHGMDTIGSGATIAWAMECFEHGLLTPADTGGLEPRFGDAAAMLTLLEQMAERRDFGAVLADGSAAAAARIGRGTDAFLVAVKGAELPAHMPEVKRSLALIYAVNPFGPDHQSSEHDPSYAPDAPAEDQQRLAHLGLTRPEAMDVLDDEKVRFAWTTQKVFSLADTLNLCQFDWGPAWQLYGPEHFARMVRAVTGWDVTLDELLLAAERRIHMMRAFNQREGFDRSHDTLPRRLAEPRVGGPSDGVAVPPAELERAKDAYYRLAGWDPATGNPTAATLRRVGLDWLADTLAPELEA
ncbi:MAG TPA: aldehyde ferredoxin oxidoreductase family protein [Chloroflexota bacterium]|nr:aldehyde ferredoxin oxidoreductase family protein [Chloroflexota bacterium]